MAAYVFQEDSGTSFRRRWWGSITLYPRLKRSKDGVYKEAWDRLRGPARVNRIEAYAAETFAEVFRAEVGVAAELG
jgi:hypothetical protein